MLISAVRCFWLSICLIAFSSVAAQDRLKIQGIAGSDEVVVMFDARTAQGCANDQVMRSTGDTSLGDLRSSGVCNSEIAIFSANNAMLLETTKNAWTDGPDNLTVTLPPRIKVPVNVWIAHRAAVEAANKQMQRTEELFQLNRVGVHFVFNVRDVSNNATAVSIIMGGVVAPGGNPSCTDIERIQQSAFYSAKTLNVYYVNLEFTGRNCALKRTPSRDECPEASGHPKADGNINFIGTDANPASLAHEFGHAFGLRPGPCGGHTESLGSAFDDKNIMLGGGDENRRHFTLGQVFRMNTHIDRWGGTMLIENGLRPSPGRACPPTLNATDICPALDRD